jgi:hypothetical protein
MFCIQCGSYNPDHAQFCGVCGYRGREDRDSSGMIPGPSMPIGGAQPGSIPMAQGTPQIGQVPYVQGTPSPSAPGSVPLAQHINIPPGSSSPLAPSEAMRFPQTDPHPYPQHPGQPLPHPSHPAHFTGPIQGHPGHPLPHPHIQGIFSRAGRNITHTPRSIPSICNREGSRHTRHQITYVRPCPRR